MKVDVARYEYEQLRSRPGDVHGLMQEQRLGMAILETWQVARNFSDVAGLLGARLMLRKWRVVRVLETGLENLSVYC